MRCSGVTLPIPRHLSTEYVGSEEEIDKKRLEHVMIPKKHYGHEDQRTACVGTVRRATLPSTHQF
jgi:hypothetical protein